jgi:hypothetical protein
MIVAVIEMAVILMVVIIVTATVIMTVAMQFRLKNPFLLLLLVVIHQCLARDLILPTKFEDSKIQSF